MDDQHIKLGFKLLGDSVKQLADQSNEIVKMIAALLPAGFPEEQKKGLIEAAEKAKQEIAVGYKKFEEEYLKG